MRFLFASFNLLITLGLFISCQNIPSECPSIKYNGDLTTLDGLPLSGSCATLLQGVKNVLQYTTLQTRQGSRGMAFLLLKWEFNDQRFF